MTHIGWIELLAADELLRMAPSLRLLQDDDLFTLDDAAELLLEGAEEKFFGLPGKHQSAELRRLARDPQGARLDQKFWKQVKAEFHEFLCTDSEKYDELRQQVTGATRPITTTIVGAVAAFIGPAIGVAAASLTGLVAVCLYGVLRFGKEAYCSMNAEQ